MMRKLRPGPTLNTEVSPVPGLGLPRGPEHHSCLTGLLQGSWSSGLFLWETVTLLCCPRTRELEAKPGTPSPGLVHSGVGNGKGEPRNAFSTHIPCFPAGGSGIHRQLDKEPVFGAEYRSKVRDWGGVAGFGWGNAWGSAGVGLLLALGAGSTECLLRVWSSSAKALGTNLCSKRSCQTPST